MTNQTSRLSIVLHDGVTGPAKGVAQSLKTLGMSAKDVAKLERIGKFRELQKGMVGARQQFAAAQVEVKKLAKEIAAVDNPTRQMRQQFLAAQRAVKSSAAEFRQQATALKASRSELERAGVPLRSLAAEEARLRSNINATTAAIANQTRAHRALGAVRRIGAGVVGQTVGGIAGIATGAGALRFAKKAVVSAAEFDTETRKQRVFTDVSEEQQRKLLSPQAKRIGQETPFTNLDVVRAQTAAMQGLPASMGPDIKASVAAGMVEHAKYYATLMEVDLKDAAQAIREFLITTGKDIATQDKALTEAQKAVNQIIRMSKLGGMSGEDSQQYLKYAAGAATTAGISPEAMMAIGALARRGGLRGDEAGIFMRTTAAKLVAPGRAGLAALSAAGIDYSKYRQMPSRIDPATLETQFQNRLGVSFTPAIRKQLEAAMSDPKVLGSQGAFTAAISKILGPVTGKGGGAASKSKVAGALAEFYGMSAQSVDAKRLLDDIMKSNISLAQLNALLGYRQGGRGAITQRQRDEYVAAQREIEAAGDDPDFAKRRFDEVAAGLGYALENLKGSVENLILSMGQANEGLLKVSFDRLGEAFDAISNMSAPARQVATAFGGIAAALTAAGGIKLLMGGFGLKGSAVALDASAAALTRAAVALGGAGTGAGAAAAGGAAAGAAGKSLGKKIIGAIPGVGLGVAAIQAAQALEPNLFGGNHDPARREREAKRRGAIIQRWNEDRARHGIKPLGAPDAPGPRTSAPTRRLPFPDLMPRPGLDLPWREGVPPIIDATRRQSAATVAARAKIAWDELMERLGIGGPPVVPAAAPTAPRRPAAAHPNVETKELDGAGDKARVDTEQPDDVRAPIMRPRMEPGLSDGPVVPQVDTEQLDDAAEKAKRTGETLKQSLDITTTPKVDTASFDAALRTLREIEQSLQRISSMTVRPTVAPNVLPTNVPGLQRAQETIRAAHADYGIRAV